MKKNAQATLIALCTSLAASSSAATDRDEVAQAERDRDAVHLIQGGAGRSLARRTTSDDSTPPDAKGPKVQVKFEAVDDKFDQNEGNGWSSEYQREQTFLSAHSDFLLVRVLETQIEEALIPDDVLLQTRYFGVDVLSGELVVWIQPGASISSTIVESLCGNPAISQHGRTYLISPVVDTVSGDFWIHNLADIVDVTETYGAP